MSDSTAQPPRTKKRTRKPGSLRDLQQVVWRAVLVAQRIVATSADEDTQLRAIAVLAQASMNYARIVEVGKLPQA